ncbi:hypothetical protein Y1Q_0009972 [Alligator mississippiensis]|uniref:ribonuclease H n=1 Tax=Alligator mississippiensis TaxID=8496 RepID=A0A151MXB8_ALLMI|nr:hypothetical protein Y1Q_0009972 [Alligator mississippiensis]
MGEVWWHLQEFLNHKIIRESKSPYASSIVIVCKKNGNLQMCIDYRVLNTHMVVDQYTVPLVQEALDCLGGSKWFTVLGPCSGYYQIPLREADKEKTAFICPLGFFQFEYTLQGISGAPAMFQHLMEKVVRDMHLTQVLVYLDDLIVFGKTLEEHDERLLHVLDHLEAAGLKLLLDKCKFCQASVKYVGHIISQNGVRTDPEKVKAVTTWQCPSNYGELKRFLGFTGFYRRFVPDYEAITRPPNQLTRGYQIGKSSKKRGAQDPTQGVQKVCSPSEPFGLWWEAHCEDAFHEIIRCFTEAPMLVYPDSNWPFILHTNASLSGLGVVLYQLHEGRQHPVAYASRSLVPSETRYPAHKLEFLALKWAVTEKFRDHLYGTTFQVWTDNNPLTYILTSAKLDGTGLLWVAALAD